MSIHALQGTIPRPLSCGSRPQHPTAFEAVVFATRKLPRASRIRFLREVVQPFDMSLLVQLRAELYQVIALAECESAARLALAPLDALVRDCSKPSAGLNAGAWLRRLAAALWWRRRPRRSFPHVQLPRFPPVL